MGQCCSCCQVKANHGAFRTELSSPLLNELSTKLQYERNSRIYIIRLNRIKDVPIGDSFSGTSDTYVDLKLVPNDEIAGMQRQSSSIKPGTLCPKWDPPERFQIVCSSPGDKRVILSVYHYYKLNPKNSYPLGDSILKLKEINALNIPVEKNLKLINPTDGKACGEMNLTITMMTLNDALNVQEHCVYEFERWNPVNSWGSSDLHFLPTDPGRWCTEDGKRFAKSIDQVAPPIPEGWTIDSNWHTFGTDFDAEGWQYSTVMESPYWYDKSDTAYVVRRRTWHRVVKNDKPSREQRVSSSGEKKKRIF